MADLVPSSNRAPSRTQGMLCPVCRVDLVLADRQGIEIDYCPQCRGIWLDRGELDKIIERNASYEDTRAAPPAPAQGAVPMPGYAQPWGGGYREEHHGGGHGGGHHGGGGHGGYRPGGFLGGLFRH